MANKLWLCSDRDPILIHLISEEFHASDNGHYRDIAKLTQAQPQLKFS